MPYTLPTFRQIRTRVQTDMAAFANGITGPVELALANALSAVGKGLYGYIGYVLREAFPDTAQDNFWRWAHIYGIDQKAAEEWVGTYLFTGTNGITIPNGSEVQRADGQLYETQADGLIASGSVTVPLRAQVAGKDGNCVNGQVLTISIPITGVDSEGSVVTTTTTGSDAETNSEGLTRLLYRLSHPPRGGAPGDYITWALENSGVTRAWEFPLIEGPNTVSVAFARDDDGLDTAIIPDGAERTTVQTYLDAVAPVTSDVRVITLTALSVAITFTDLTPNTLAVQNSIKDAVRDLFFREGGPGETITPADVTVAISTATGITGFTISAPSTNLVTATNQIHVLGTVTFP